MTSSCPRSFPRPSRHHQDLGRRSHPSHFASTAPYLPASTSVDRNAKACPLHSCSQLTLSGWKIPVTWMYGRQYRTPKHAEEDWSSSPKCFFFAQKHKNSGDPLGPENPFLGTHNHPLFFLAIQSSQLDRRVRAHSTVFIRLSTPPEQENRLDSA